MHGPVFLLKVKTSRRKPSNNVSPSGFAFICPVIGIGINLVLVIGFVVILAQVVDKRSGGIVVKDDCPVPPASETLRFGTFKVFKIPGFCKLIRVCFCAGEGVCILNLRRTRGK